MELCQLDKIYVYNLINYNKVLGQRNQLLKDIYMKPELERYSGCMGYAACRVWK